MHGSFITAKILSAAISTEPAFLIQNGIQGRKAVVALFVPSKVGILEKVVVIADVRGSYDCVACLEEVMARNEVCFRQGFLGEKGLLI